jgi:GTP pyrophosphokinase
VRQWFKQQNFEHHLATGRASLDKEIERLGLKRPDLSQVAKHFNFKRMEDLLAAIGNGELSPVQVANSLGRPEQTETESDEPMPLPVRSPQRKTAARRGSAVVLAGMDDLLYSLAKCCKPVPCDPIIGFITRGKGVTVHRQDCPVVAKLPEADRDRLIQADWGEHKGDERYAVDILISAGDRRGLLRDISAIFSAEDVDVLGVSSQSSRKRDRADFRFTVEIRDMSELSRVLDKIAQLPDVMQVRRRVK